MKLTFVYNPPDDFTNSSTRITYETDNEILGEVIEDFKYFLRGCGYSVGDLVECGEDEE